MGALLPDFYSSQVPRSMQIHPFYDPQAAEWVAEFNGKVFAADSLRLLQKQLPKVQIKDYYPDGYRATFPRTIKHTRVSLPPSNVGCSKVKAITLARFEPVATTRDNILAFVAQGMRSPQIAKRLGCELRIVQSCRREACEAKDPRVPVKPARVTLEWTPERKARLKELAAKGLTSAQISAEIGGTPHSIIGYCYRQKIPLLSKVNKNGNDSC